MSIATTYLSTYPCWTDLSDAAHVFLLCGSVFLLADVAGILAAPDGQVADALAANVTDATPTWFLNVMEGLALAAKVAPMVIPLL